MALVPTAVGLYESKSAFGTGAFSTGSFTPAANSLLVVGVLFVGSGTEGDLGTPTISGGGLTYTSIASAFGSAAWSVKLVVFTAQVGSSPSSMTITVDDDNNQNIDAYTVSVMTYTGHDTTTPVAGAVTSSSTNIGDGEEKQTLGAAPVSEDHTLSWIGLDTSVGPPKATLASGWTKVHEGKLSGEGGLQVIRREGSTSTEVKVTDVYTAGGSFHKGMMVSLIIKAATSLDVTITASIGATAAVPAPTPSTSISPPAAAAGAVTPVPQLSVSLGTSAAASASTGPPIPSTTISPPAAAAAAAGPTPGLELSVAAPGGGAAASGGSPTPAVLIGASPAPAAAAVPPPTVVIEEAAETPDFPLPTAVDLLSEWGAAAAIAQAPLRLTIRPVRATALVAGYSAEVEVSPHDAAAAIAAGRSATEIHEHRTEVTIDA